MQDKNLYEYAVIRIMPRVERDEFVNAGILLFCKKQRFLQIKYVIPQQKINCICPEADCENISLLLKAFERICNGDANGGPIAQLPVAERFRWLTAMRSTVIQTSMVHPGLSDNLSETLVRLFDAMVG